MSTTISLLFPSDARTLHGLNQSVDCETLVTPDRAGHQPITHQRKRAASDLPTFDNTADNLDNLFDVSAI